MILMLIYCIANLVIFFQGCWHIFVRLEDRQYHPHPRKNQGADTFEGFYFYMLSQIKDLFLFVNIKCCKLKCLIFSVTSWGPGVYNFPTLNSRIRYHGCNRCQRWGDQRVHPNFLAAHCQKGLILIFVASSILLVGENTKNRFCVFVWE